jgi:hypothetical protein
MVSNAQPVSPQPILNDVRGERERVKNMTQALMEMIE